jgi:RNA polymerase sigma factor for flagellar operon FliA
LDSPVSFSEIIPDRSRPSPPQQISRKEEKRILLEAIQNLSRQEKIVLTLYYFEEFTLREIGEVLGVSESRICQIHSKAIYRLRARLSMSEVTDYAPH